MLGAVDVCHVYAGDPHSEGSISHSPSQRFLRKLNVRPDYQARDLQVHTKKNVSERGWHCDDCCGNRFNSPVNFPGAMGRGKDQEVLCIPHSQHALHVTRLCVIKRTRCKNMLLILIGKVQQHNMEYPPSR